MQITSDDYFGPYKDHPEVTAEMLANARELLDRVNQLRDLAAADGVVFRLNPNTGTAVSGGGNGGFRIQACKIGATHSSHKMARAIDNFDPLRRFASWCVANQESMQRLGLWMERAEWTPTWVHLQSIPPGSGVRIFVPSPLAALAPPPPPFE